MVPTLRAGPFRLRAFSHADLDVVREAATDEYIVSTTTVPSPYTEEEGREFVQRQWDRATTGSGYSFAITDAGTDRALGQVGLWLRDLDTGRGALGYWVVASQRRRGAAAHAVNAITRWAFDQLRLARLELYVEPWNEASIQAAQRAGFQREGLLRSWKVVGGQRRDMWMYSLLPADPPPG